MINPKYCKEEMIGISKKIMNNPKYCKEEMIGIINKRND